jgi:hypothetical protein
MTKQTGATGGQRLFVDGYDVSGNIAALSSMSATRDQLDYTDITQTAKDRRGGLVDGKMSFKGWWDATVGATPPAVHDIFKVPRTAAIVTFWDAQLAGSAACGLAADQANYKVDRAEAGSLAWTVDAEASGGFGLEWGYSLTAGNQLFASGTLYGSDCDDLVGAPTSTAFGAILYVHLISIASGNITISVVEGSSASPTAAIAGCTTALLTAQGAYRLPSTSATATIRQYTRLKVAGTYANARVAAMLVRPIGPQA